jgi:ABC-type multidrug transport system fused ATPase/permease subunit
LNHAVTGLTASQIINNVFGGSLGDGKASGFDLVERRKMHRLTTVPSYILLVGLPWALASGNKTLATSGLFWNNLSVQIPGGHFLLHDFTGFIPNGHICGILGPSGAGKVCLTGL